MCDSIDIGYGGSLEEGIRILKRFGSGTGVGGYGEKEETYLLLKRELDRGEEPEKRNGTLEYKNEGIRLIPKTLGVDFFDTDKKEKIPKNIKDLVIKLQTLNE